MAGLQWAVHLPWGLWAWVLGVALQLQQAQLWPAWAYALLGLAALAALRIVKGQTKGVCASLAALAVALTGLHAVSRLPSIASELEGRDLDVVGVVQAMPQSQDVGLRFRFQIEQASLAGDHQSVLPQLPAQVYLGWYAASAFEGTAGLAPVPAVQAGERWRFRVRLKAPHGQMNPGGFDYELWLWEQGIRGVGYVRQGRSDPAPVLLGQTHGQPMEWARQSVRDRMRARWANPPENAQRQGLNAQGIVVALVTGDQAAIDRSDWDVFRATGVSHLMSISGLHVTMLAWLAGAMAAAAWRRTAVWGWTWALHWPAPTVGALAGLGVAALYALFSGWGVPAQRTVWMLAVWALLKWSARDWHWRVVWGLAAAVVLSLDPWALLQPGFWLSFVAVGVLLMADPGREAHAMARQCTDLDEKSTKSVLWRDSVGVRLKGLVREQLVVTCALTPLTVLFFGQFSAVGLLANLIAIPWVTLWVTPLALLGLVLPWAWDAAQWSLQPLATVLAWMATWPGASWTLPMPPWPLAALALLGAVAIVVAGPWSWRIWGVPLVLPALLWAAPRPAVGTFELLVADVGQGNAVLVRTATHSLLYDAGPRYSPESDAGHRVLVPLLAQTGEHLDMLMLSHRDSDHTGGAAAVLAMQPQVALRSSLEPSHPLLQGRAGQRCEAGQQWVWDGVLFEVLHPLRADYEGARKSNALSCVLRVGGTALLAGDIEAPQERELLARGLSPVDFLLVPHHGSKTSSTPEFLDALQPGMAMVQAGYRNRFGHPAAPVTDRYTQRATDVTDSAHCGAALWKSVAPQKRDCQRVDHLRYWHHRVP